MIEKRLNEYLNKFEAAMPAFHKAMQSPNSNFLTGLHLTITQCMVLKNLSQNDNCKMSELSGALGVTLANMTSMADRMERDGYLRRVPDSEDRRIVRIKMTPKGKNIIRKMEGERRKSLVSILSKLSDQEIENLLKIMTKIAEG